MVVWSRCSPSPCRCRNEANRCSSSLASTDAWPRRKIGVGGKTASNRRRLDWSQQFRARSANRGVRKTTCRTVYAALQREHAAIRHRRSADRPKSGSCERQRGTPASRSMLATSSSAGGRWLCLGRRRPSLSTAGASPSSAPAAVTVTTYDPTREAAMMVKSRQLYRHGFGSVCCSGPAKEPDWQYEKPETKRQEAMQGRRPAQLHQPRLKSVGRSRVQMPGGAGKFIPWVKDGEDMGRVAES